MSTPDLHPSPGWPAPSSGSGADPYAVPSGRPGSPSPYAPQYAPQYAATAGGHGSATQDPAVAHLAAPYALDVAAPYAPAQYAAPQDGPGRSGAPEYGAQQYGAPQYGAAQYGAPQYGAAQYRAAHRAPQDARHAVAPAPLGPLPAAPWQHAMTHPGQHQPFPSAPGTTDRRPNGLAVAALALGCVAIVVLGVQTGIASAVLAVVGLVLGIVGLTGAGRSRAGSRGLAIGGVTTSAAAAVLAGSVFVVTGTPVGEGLQAGLASAAWGTYDLPVVSLRPGEPAAVGDYTVTVDDIQMDADAALAADPLNDAALGRYVQVVVTVRYDGSGFGVPEEDLLVSYVGSNDDWTYDEWSCAAVTDRPVFEVGRMTQGQTATFVSCIDVPVEVIDETAVIVEDLDATDLTAELWGVR